MTDILERIENGMGILTDEEREALDAYADDLGSPKEVYQVYDDSNVTDNDYLGTERVGDRHSTVEGAVDWAKRQGFSCFAVYVERRCVTRKRQIWYVRGGSPVFDWA